MTGKVYISGPMTGLPGFNRPAFHGAAQALRALGYEVFNPAEQPLHPEWSDYMRHDIKALMDCGTVVVLDGAFQSRGAMIELNLAQALGMEIVRFGDVRLEKVA